MGEVSMSDAGQSARKPGPTLATSIDVIEGTFLSDEALQDAISRLEVSGFDRADISVSEPSAEHASGSPEQSAANPHTDADTRQSRTLHTSLAASVGAMAGAGAVIATGGAALPAVAAAIAGGVGLGAVMEGVTRATDKLQHEERNEAGAKGKLALSVRLRRAEQEPIALAAMRDAGAVQVDAVRRSSG
jgi:hypothetical protein